jgi:hypothetical protein
MGLNERRRESVAGELGNWNIPSSQKNVEDREKDGKDNL